MTTSESARLHLYEAARDSWDEAAATALMDSLPPAADELVTKSFLKAEMAELRAKMYERFHEQTRTMIIAMITIMLAGVSLAFTAAHLE